MKSKTKVSVMAAVAALATLTYTLRAQSASVSIWDGVFSEEQAKRGEALSKQHCAQCHGAKLEGGEAAPPLAGENFLANWNGQTSGPLFDRIRKTMPQDKPGTLKPEVNADILAYMFSVNQFPAGKSDLPSTTEALKQIRIEAKKPDPK